MKINKTTAIKKARAEVSTLFKFGNGYKFTVWCESSNCWIDHGVYDYWLASWGRSQTMLDIARDLLEKPWKEYSGLGRWTDLV